MSIVTIAEVQAITQTTYSVSTSPTSTQVSAWITEAETWISEYSGFAFSSSTATGEKHDANGCYVLLDHFPVITITSLSIDGAVLVEDTDFSIKDAQAGWIELSYDPANNILGEKYKQILVTYTYGVTAVPQNIKELCATVVALRAISAAAVKNNPGGTLKSFSDGDISISYAETDSGVLAQLIARYKELKQLAPRRIPLVVVGA